MGFRVRFFGGFARADSGFCLTLVFAKMAKMKYVCKKMVSGFNIQQYTVIYSNIQQYTAIYSNIQQYTVIYSNIQHYTAIYSNIQHYTALYRVSIYSSDLRLGIANHRPYTPNPTP